MDVGKDQGFCLQAFDEFFATFFWKMATFLENIIFPHREWYGIIPGQMKNVKVIPHRISSFSNFLFLDGENVAHIPGQVNK